MHNILQYISGFDCDRHWKLRHVGEMGHTWAGRWTGSETQLMVHTKLSGMHRELNHGTHNGGRTILCFIVLWAFSEDYATVSLTLTHSTTEAHSPFWRRICATFTWLLSRAIRKEVSPRYKKQQETRGEDVGNGLSCCLQANCFKWCLVMVICK